MNCSEFQASLVDLQELGSVELLGLERHADTCPGCGERLNGYRGLMAALRVVGGPSHIEGDRLTRFAIHRAAPNEPDYDQARLSAVEIQQIEGHVSECPRCRLAVDSIISQYGEMDVFFAEAGVPHLAIDRTTLWDFVRDALERAASWTKNVIVLPTPYSAGVALGVVLLAGGLWLGPWLRDPYHQLSLLEATEIQYVTRGSSAGPNPGADAGNALARGMSLMNEGRYAEAIPVLEEIRNDALDENLEGYTHYLSGVASLYESRTEIFGRVIAFNEDRLQRAIEHLESVAGRTASGRVLEDAYWFLGKAYLMKREPSRAIHALTECVEIQGRRAAGARELIADIEDID